MTNESGFGKSLEMAALKKKQQLTGADVDLMRPGNGTPWEDRGSIGTVVAYFSTAMKSLFSPALLMDHIRRPETVSESKVFAIVSGAMWIVGILAWNAYYYHTLPNADWQVDSPMNFWITAAAQCVVTAVGLFLFVRVGTRLFASLGGSELKGATPSLIQNIFCYSMGPSILAVVPIFGWGLAAFWIFIVLVVACKRRLYMKTSSSIINPMILVVSTVVLAIIVFFVLHLIWSTFLGMNGLVPPPPPPEAKPKTFHA